MWSLFSSYLLYRILRDSKIKINIIQNYWIEENKIYKNRYFKKKKSFKMLVMLTILF